MKPIRSGTGNIHPMMAKNRQNSIWIRVNKFGTYLGVLLLEFDSICRFRVVEEQFADTRPVGEQQQPGKEGSDQVERPYTIVVSGWM